MATKRKRGNFSSYGFFVSIEGEVELKRRLAKVRDAALDLKPAFRVVAANLRAHAREQFDTSGAAGGRPWAPLTPTTIGLRNHYRKYGGKAWGRYYGRKASGGSRPLVASGGLRKSFVEKGPKHVETIGAESMEWGSKHPLAHLVVKGSKTRGKAPPLKARPVIAFRDDAQRRELTVEPISRYLGEAAEGRI